MLDLIDLFELNFGIFPKFVPQPELTLLILSMSLIWGVVLYVWTFCGKKGSCYLC